MLDEPSTGYISEKEYVVAQSLELNSEEDHYRAAISMLSTRQVRCSNSLDPAPDIT